PLGGRTWSSAGQWDQDGPSGQQPPADQRQLFGREEQRVGVGEQPAAPPPPGVLGGDREPLPPAAPASPPATPAPAASPPAPPSPPTGAQVAPPPDHPVQHQVPGPALASRVLRAFLPALVTLVVAALAATGFANRAETLHDRADDASRAAAEQRAVR